MLGIIYKATNIKNDKSYIGQTSRCLDVRKNEHINSKHKNNYFHNALKKYGSKYFNWNILCECDSKNELDDMEHHYIKQYNTKSNGYNLTFGGEGTMGYRHTEETKKKISKNHADTSGEKNGFFGKKHNKNTIEKMKSKELAGKNNPMYGKKHTKKSINKNKWNNSNNLWFVETPNKQGIWLFNLSEFCRNNKLNRGNITTYSVTKGYEATKLC